MGAEFFEIQDSVIHFVKDECIYFYSEGNLISYLYKEDKIEKVSFQAKINSFKILDDQYVYWRSQGHSSFRGVVSSNIMFDKINSLEELEYKVND